MKLTEKEIYAYNTGYNTGLKQAQWQVTKIMLSLKTHYEDTLIAEQIHNLLKSIHDEIEKEKK